MASSTENQYHGSIAELCGSKVVRLERQANQLWCATVEHASHDGRHTLRRDLRNVSADSFREVQVLTGCDKNAQLAELAALCG